MFCAWYPTPGHENGPHLYYGNPFCPAWLQERIQAAFLGTADDRHMVREFNESRCSLVAHPSNGSRDKGPSCFSRQRFDSDYSPGFRRAVVGQAWRIFCLPAVWLARIATYFCLAGNRISGLEAYPE